MQANVPQGQADLDAFDDFTGASADADDFEFADFGEAEPVAALAVRIL